MKIEDTGTKNLLDYADLKHNDPILYLGGRVDDNNLYPTDYVKYLNGKIKKLNPKHIICHNHWYAWKYYDKGILDESMKIDTIMCYRDHIHNDHFDPINKEDYSGEHRWCILPLVEKNPDIVFSIYDPWKHKHHQPSVEIDVEWFNEADANIDDNNFRYFSFDRSYSPEELTKIYRMGRPPTDPTLGHGDHIRNSTDGFAILTNLLKLGFEQLNIIGFTAFGSDEDDSNFSTYETSHDGMIKGSTYFKLGTSEDQLAEADILKYWTERKKIYNLENYEILTRCIEKKNKC